MTLLNEKGKSEVTNEKTNPHYNFHILSPPYTLSFPHPRWWWPKTMEKQNKPDVDGSHSTTLEQRVPYCTDSQCTQKDSRGCPKARNKVLACDFGISYTEITCHFLLVEVWHSSATWPCQTPTEKKRGTAQRFQYFGRALPPSKTGQNLIWNLPNLWLQMPLCNYSINESTMRAADRI